MKEARYPTNEFQVWQRGALDGRFFICDLDTWALTISHTARGFEPLALVELKRSYLDPRDWRPFADDRPQYAALLGLAERAGVPLWVIYFRKGEPVTDASLFHLFELTAAVPAYHGRRRLIRAGDFAQAYPDVWAGPA